MAYFEVTLQYIYKDFEFEAQSVFCFALISGLIRRVISVCYQVYTEYNITF